MRRIFTFLAFILIVCTTSAAPDAAAWTPIENQVAKITAGPQVTIVHFWAPWCPTCDAELRRQGWRDFLLVNGEVKVIFVTIWNDEDGHEALKKAGLGEQPNFQLLLHPNGSRKAGDRVDHFMSQSIDWIPTTWIYKDGQLRYALNYGEVRFSLLQQLVRDAADAWSHSEAKTQK